MTSEIKTGLEKGQEKFPISEFDARTQMQFIKKSPLLRVHFRRIVLDEGHVIKDVKSNNAAVVCRIRADMRWVVTATPINNKPDDLFPMLRFLRIAPFNDYNVS